MSMTRDKMLDRLKALPGARLDELIFTFQVNDIIPANVAATQRAIHLIRAIESLGPDAWQRLEDELVRLTQGRRAENTDTDSEQAADDAPSAPDRTGSSADEAAQSQNAAPGDPAAQEQSATAESPHASSSSFPRMLTHRALPIGAVFVLPIVVFLLWPAGDPVSIGQVLKENGFVELKPPSTLVPPGTWVNVLSSEPMHLGIICPPETSLGLRDEEQLRDSTSISMQMTSSLRSEFSLGSKAVESLKSGGEFEDVASISFQLANVRLLEIPDDVVIGGLQERVGSCRDAIRFRVQQGDAVTMIKSVLMADADYKVTFSRELSSESQVKMRRRLALEMDLRMKRDESGVARITGRNLIWGVREDRALALKGLGLPATGGTGSEENALPDDSTVGTISLDQQKRREFPSDETVIAHSVEPIRQTSPMACWATVCAMMWSWKTEEPQTPAQAVASLGSPWDDYYLEDAGLPPGEEQAFADACGMNTLPPANYTIDAWVEMMSTHGPL